MNIVFYIAAAVSIVSTIMVISRHNPVHALLYLIVSLLSLSLIFFLLGAPFAAILEVIIYAGAIMVLFIFVIMLLNLGEQTAAQERAWLKPKVWIGPSVLCFILLAELIFMMVVQSQSGSEPKVVSPKDVAHSLFTAYTIGAELAAMLLMAGVVGAAHIGQHKKLVIHRFLKERAAYEA